jgi:hypothetical protein
MAVISMVTSADSDVLRPGEKLHRVESFDHVAPIVDEHLGERVSVGLFHRFELLGSPTKNAF